MTSLETKVTDAILQRSEESITIDGHEYPIGPPTPGTIILISELVAQMPEINPEPKNIYHEVLRTAKDLSILGRIVATLILGAKRIKECRKVIVNEGIEYYERWSWRRLRKVTESRQIVSEKLEIDWLTEKLINEVSSEVQSKIVAKRLGMHHIADFFELTTFLSEANRLKATREVETASGE